MMVMWNDIAITIIEYDERMEHDNNRTDGYPSEEQTYNKAIFTITFTYQPHPCSA